MDTAKTEATAYHAFHMNSWCLENIFMDFLMDIFLEALIHIITSLQWKWKLLQLSKNRSFSGLNKTKKTYGP